jgi:K+-transporting ATPase ATPase B chain
MKPEGKSIIELSQLKSKIYWFQSTYIDFTAETRTSGIDFEETRIRKGAYDTIKKLTEKAGNLFPQETQDAVTKISENGGTPLVVAVNEKVWGVIELQDIIKTGIQERFQRLRKMG